MKYRIITALILTLILLVVARRASMRQQPPIRESVTLNNLILTHNSTHIFKGDTTSAVIPVEIRGQALSAAERVAFYYRPRVAGEKQGFGDFSRIELQRVPANTLIYRCALTNQGRGTEFEYYLQLEDSSGVALATIPAACQVDKTSTLWLRFEGKQSTPLLIAHIAGMFGGLFFAVLAFLTCFANLNDTRINIQLGRQVLWTVIILFLGTFPFGFLIEYQVYGTYWTGIPVGRDITDSKGLIVFLCWLVALILLKGSAFAKDPTRNLVKVRGARIVVVFSLIVTLALYLIPHSSGNF
ncbi:MAG: hypothetical protein KAT58_07365 [candidate division Zixibacteria bacterium]|nr:hypothetical protein [candidate division Zixibacteria bacterium]